MSPLPTNQHLPRRSRRLQHGVSHSGQICPLHHACNTCPRGPKDQNQGVGFPEMPPSPCWQHLSVHLAQQTGTSEMPHSPGNTCHVVQKTGTQRCLVHLATPAMWSRRANHTTATAEIPPLLATREHLSKRSRIPNHRAVTPQIPHSPRNTCP